MIHDQVLILSLLLMLFVLAAFVYVFVNSAEVEEDYTLISTRSYAFRSKTFWLIGLAGVLIAALSTRGLPYATASANAKEISVVGKQWYWEIDDLTAEVNQPIVFNVTSGDVNHGLGIYDEDLRLLGQVQAMPDYTNKLNFTFKKPGKYKLMCMEYCGLVHHVMISDFIVSEKGGAQ